MKKLTFMVTTGLLTLALVTTGCGTKNAPGAEGETADSTAVEVEAADESAYDLEAIAKAIEGCEDLTSFRSGLAGVMKDGKVGYIDKKGNVVIPFEYRSPTQVFCDDVVAVFKGDDVIYMDPKGKELFRTKSFGRFHDGLCSNREDVGPDKAGKIGFIDKTGKMVIKMENGYGSEFHDGIAKVIAPNRTYFIDKTGKEVFELDEKYKNAEYYSEGAWLVNDGEHHMGFIDNTGKTIVPCKYYAYTPFSEGLAMVQDKQNGRYGFVDKEGKSTFEY